jgi:hypothetical protein
VIWASSVPDAINGLVAALTGSSNLDAVRVFDGPAVTGSSATEVITVGYNGGQDDDAVDGALALEGAARSSSRERYVIRCAASVVKGSGQITDARSRAYELVGYVGAALAADKTLGNAVMSASIGGTRLRQSQDSRGAAATVLFEVMIDAFTRRS